MSGQPPNCTVCEHAQHFGKSPYCRGCRRLISQALGTGNRGRTTIRSPEAQQAIRRSLAWGERLYGKRGVHACHYSGIKLTTKKSHAVRGDYATFDHVIPNDPSLAVLCARVINDLKGAMTDFEFAEYIRHALDLPAMRKIHSLTVKQSRQFFSELRTAVYGAEREAAQARVVLKCLAASVRYEPKPKMPPAELPVVDVIVDRETPD